MQHHVTVCPWRTPHYHGQAASALYKHKEVEDLHEYASPSTGTVCTAAATTSHTKSLEHAYRTS